MKTIKLLILAVLLHTTYSNFAYDVAKKYLDETCQHKHHDITNTQNQTNNFGVKGLNLFMESGNIRYYVDNQKRLIKHVKLKKLADIYSQRTLIDLQKKVGNYYDLGEILPPGCLYNMLKSNKYSGTSLSDEVNIFTVKHKYDHDLYDVVSSGKSYTQQIQWKFDMMIKALLAVSHLHENGYIHRGIDYTVFKIKEPIDKLVITLILTSYEFFIKIGQRDKLPISPSFFTPPEAEEKPLARPTFDVYSLGRLFYFIMNFKAYEKYRNRGTLITCEEEDTLNFLDPIYCEYIDDLVELMTKPNPEERPSLEVILVTLRARRQLISDENMRKFSYYQMIVKKGEKVDQDGRWSKLTPDERNLAIEGMNLYSEFYENYVLMSKQIVDNQYQDPNNPIHKNFINEHKEAIKALQEAGAYEKLVI